MGKNNGVYPLLSAVLAFVIVAGNLYYPDFAYGNLDISKGVNGPRQVLKKDSSSGNQVDIDRGYTISEKRNDGKDKILRPYVEGELIVKYKKGAIDLLSEGGKGKMDSFLTTNGLKKKDDIRGENAALLSFGKGKSVKEKMDELRADPSVESVQPNYIYYPMEIGTNDTYRANMWGLDNTGQTTTAGITGVSDADMDAPEAWAVNEGTNGQVIVAVIDTGVAYNHPDLISNMWDGSGCVDHNNAALGGCSHGYDYEDNDKIPLPTSSPHGTHVAGIIAASKNNGRGILGIAPNVKIMALKSGLTTTDNVNSINFAKYNGAKVINASWGGPSYDALLESAISGFPGLFMAAAGNGTNYGSASVGDNHDGEIHVYPSDYTLDNIISVAATTSSDGIATFSDYGSVSVDVGAPGHYIYSTVVGANAMNETFDSLTPPEIPAGWVKGGTGNNWGSYDFNDGYWEGALYGDLAMPYADTSVMDTHVVTPTVNLSGKVGASLTFWTQCDTEYLTDGWGDYMSLSLSSDGSTFNEFLKWDEAYIDSDTDPTGAASYKFNGVSIPASYLVPGFKMMFRWVTNGNGNYGSNGDGCLIDDVAINYYNDGSDEPYGYMSGTSMAAPYVAGLAGLIEGYNTGLTTAEVKNVIMTTGDSIAALSGKTVSGKRVNAQKALEAVTPVSISGTVTYYDGVKVVPNVTMKLLDGSNNQLATTTTDSNGDYSFTGLDKGGDYKVVTEKSGDYTGLTSLDQLIIQRHILNLQPITDINKFVAADVDNNGNLTSLDRLAIKRFIIGVDTWTTNVWKFYSSGVTLNSSNYLTEGPSRTYSNLLTNMVDQDFTGIKMGDVNNSWVNN